MKGRIALKYLTCLRLLGVASASLVGLACGHENPSDIEDGARKSPTSLERSLADLPKADVVDDDEDGVPTFVTGDLGGAAANFAARSDPGTLLLPIAAVFRASVSDLHLEREHTDALGDGHLRFRQRKNGLDVIGGELVLHIRRGKVMAANGHARDDLPAAIQPVVSAQTAIATVERLSPSVANRSVFSKEPDAYWAVPGKLELVHRVEVTGSSDQLPLHDTVLVSAETGAVLARLSHVHTAKARAVHDAEHRQLPSDLPGPLVRSEGQEPHADPVVNTNYNHLGTTYDGYRELFGRDSFDDRGARLISSVHVGHNVTNAFWNGTQVAFGDGDGVEADSFASILDITAHELTHAVTEKTSGLVYFGESGGLNEAMSDIFGAVIEWYRDGRVVSDKIWKIGDEAWTPGTEGDALRYMNDPTRAPGSLDYYPDVQPNTDVHHSSGIANLAFYLLAQGGVHPRGKTAVRVNGIGIEKAAQIFYRANTSIMTSRDEFGEAAMATELAATQLGLSPDDVASVRAAWRAVGVAPPDSVSLMNGIPLTGLQGARASKAYYRLDVPAGASDLTFELRGGSGDADLYVRLALEPKLGRFDCRPYLPGNHETCTIPNARAGTYYVMVRGAANYAGVTLVASFKKEDAR